MSRVTRPLMQLLTCGLILSSMGCAGLNLRNMDLRSRKATARNPVSRVVCLWEPAEGRDPQGNPCHGFAGNILFLNSSSLPVSVDGDVRIYLFDDQGSVEEQSEPLHKFDFDSGAWARHYAYGTLGPAYNVFIPYMRKGAYEANCALRLRLTPKAGPPVFSDMTSIELMSFSGASRSTPKKPEADSRVEAATAEDLTSVNNRRRTTTISLGTVNGAVDSPMPDESESEIQLAAYEEEPRPLTNADARIAQLQQMVKELQEQQRLQGSNGNPAAATAVPQSPPRRLEEIEEPSRTRGRSLESVPESPTTDARSPSAAGRFTIRPANSERAVERHLLEDDDQTAVTTRRRKVHPLLDDVAPVARRNGPANRPAARHPLEEMFEGQPAVPVPTATQKVTPADGSSYGQGRSRSGDPFDPIEIDTIETTAVDERQTSRRQLRSVNH